MTTPQHPTHRRSATRAPVGRPIKLQFDDSMDVIEGTCRNISIGGMYIVFDSSRPAGSLVRFELELEGGNAIRGLGEVVWMRSKSRHEGSEAGFGLKFRFLEQRDRQLIFKLVSHHIKDRLTGREPAGGEPVAPPAERLEREPSDLEAAPEEPAPELEPPAEDAAWAELEPPAVSVEDPLLFAPEPASPAQPGAPPARRRAEGILGDEMSSEVAPPPPGGLQHGELDPSVGDTPLYELGLDPEPPGARAWEPEPAEAPAEEEETSNGSYAASPAPQRRREFAILPVLGVLLVALAAAGYLFKEELLARFGGGSAPAAEAGAAPLGAPAVAEGDETAAAQRSLPPSEVSPPPSESAPSPAASSSSEPAPPPPVAAEPSPSTLSPSPSQVPTPASGPPAAPAGATADAAFTRLVDISWREEGGALRVTLRADGAIPTGRYRYFHLAGDSPREVVKLFGVSQSFGRSELAVGGPGVRRIRTGFHRAGGANEQHVVIDLLGPGWTITEIRNLGSTLELTIAEP